MSWDAIGAIGEIVGAIAVLATLIYLALQIRQNTKAVRLESRNSLQQAWSQVGSMMANSPEITELFIKGCRDYRALPVADRLRFSSVLQNVLFAIDLQHLQASEGIHEVTGLERIHSLFRYSGVRDWWGQNKGFFRPAFVGVVESVIAEIPQGGSSAE